MWPSHEARAAKFDLIEHFDGYAGLRNGLRKAAEMQQEWAGIPMIMDGQRLVIEPTYPKAKELMAFGAEPEDDDDVDPGKVRNVFWSWRWRCQIAIWNEDGKILWGKLGVSNRIALELETLRSADAWGIEQESNAIQTLAGLLRHRQFKQYMMTGMFLESSKRSGVSYLFRKLRPTLAIKDSRMLCALCLHPIAYYEGSWAGAMTPTDDVIAHLMLMRGDEHMLWRRANQHPPYRREAGI